MAEVRESSVLFSLHQIQRIEQQRIREEEEAERRRLEAQANARRAAEARAREEREARRCAEEAQREAEEARRRESQARLEAIRVAELEKVRMDAERRDRLAMIEQANAHEQKLLALREDKQKKRMRRALTWGSAITMTLLATSVGAYFGVVLPEAERLRVEKQAERAASEAKLDELKADFDRASLRVSKAEEDLRRAHDETARLAAQQEADEARRLEEAARKRLVKTPVATAAKSPDCVCSDPNDPLCGCLNK
jgi:colicin import membrane protein